MPFLRVILLLALPLLFKLGDLLAQNPREHPAARHVFSQIHETGARQRVILTGPPEGPRVGDRPLPRFGPEWEALRKPPRTGSVYPSQERAFRRPELRGVMRESGNRLEAVRVRALIAEISDSPDTVGLDWLFGEAGTNAPTSLTPERPINLPGTGVIEGKHLQLEHLRLEQQYAIISAEQFSALMRRLEKRQGVDLLSAPSVTTLPGRRAQIAITDAHSIVTEQPDSNSKGKGQARIEQISCGQVVDLTVTAHKDHYRLEVIASIIEFLGYRAPRLETKDATASVVANIRLRDAIARADVPFGKTLVLRGVPVSTLKMARSGFSWKPGKEKMTKSLYIFLTPEAE